jgi:hypothetical protein
MYILLDTVSDPNSRTVMDYIFFIIFDHWSHKFSFFIYTVTFPEIAWCACVCVYVTLFWYKNPLLSCCVVNETLNSVCVFVSVILHTHLCVCVCV